MSVCEWGGGGGYEVRQTIRSLTFKYLTEFGSITINTPESLVVVEAPFKICNCLGVISLSLNVMGVLKVRGDWCA